MFDCCSAKNITGLLVSFVYVVHHSFLTTSPYPAEVWPDQDGQNSTDEFYVKYLSSQKTITRVCYLFGILREPQNVSSTSPVLDWLVVMIVTACVCCSVVVWDVEEFLPVSTYRGEAASDRV